MCEIENHHSDIDKKNAKAIYALLPYFHNTVLLGDSLAESILDYRLLRKNNVIAKRGRSVDQIYGDLLCVYSLRPDIVFMAYGKNDIHTFRGNEVAFVKCYKERIKWLNEHGITTIYINSIIPMRHDIMLKNGGEEAFRKFNHALRNMCDELNIVFIDNTKLMKWSDDEFEFDGIHPKYPFYQKWLCNIMKTAHLTCK